MARQTSAWSVSMSGFPAPRRSDGSICGRLHRPGGTSAALGTPSADDAPRWCRPRPGSFPMALRTVRALVRLAFIVVLLIVIDGLRSDRGEVLAAIYRTTRGWTEEGREVAACGAPVVHHRASCVIEDATGRYALAFLHDENSNARRGRHDQERGCPISECRRTPARRRACSSRCSRSRRGSRSRSRTRARTGRRLR